MKNRKIEILLTLSGVFVACNIYTLLPIYQQIAESINVSTAIVVSASSIFTLGYAIGLLIFGPLSDRIGRKKIIVLGLGLSTVTTILVGFSHSSLSLLIFRGIQGFSLGSFAPVAFAFCYDYFPLKKRTMMLAIINTGFLVAGIGGQMISAFVTERMNWSWTFYLFAIIYLSLFVLTSFFLPNTTKPIIETKNTVKIMLYLLKNPLLFLCYIIVFTLLFMFVAFYNLLNHLFHGQGNELFWIRFIGLLGAILSLYAGKMIDRFGNYNTLFIGIGLGMISVLPLFISQSVLILLATSILFVAAISLLIPTIISLIANVGGIHRAKAMSLYSFFLLIGASTSPFIFANLAFIRGIFILTGTLMIDLILILSVKRLSIKNSIKMRLCKEVSKFYIKIYK